VVRLAGIELRTEKNPWRAIGSTVALGGGRTGRLVLLEGHREILPLLTTQAYDGRLRGAAKYHRKDRHSMPVHWSTIALPGVDLSVVRQGQGTPLLLLHGGDGPQSQLPFFARLSAHFDIIAPIHPGFAGSPIPEHFDDLEDLVYLYLDLLEVLNLHQVSLLGFSMGGWVAAEIAVRNTSRLARLLLVDAVGIKPGERSTRDITDIFGLPQSEVARVLLHNPANGPNLATMADEQLTTLATDRIAHAMYTWDPYMHNPKLRYRLHRINVPTLLLWGASDRVVPVTYAQAYQRLIPGARLEVIAEAGHLPHVEQPEALLQHIVSFAAQ
jgi:pimeloyl-ACP methyl ester carboxylesterase